MNVAAVRLLNVALILALVLPAALPGESTAWAKRKRFKSVTRTIRVVQDDGIDFGSGAGVQPSIPYPSVLNVRGLRKGRIIDVNLILGDFDHSAPDDVDILLAKGDANALVMSDVGAATSRFNLDITLDDEATAELPDASALSSGDFRPTDSDSTGGDSDTFPPPAPALSTFTQLTAFDGVNPNGAWQLFVVDDNGGDPLSIGRWELEIKAKVQVKKKRKR